MEKTIEIDGVQYTEAQIRRALSIERDVRSPNFVDMLLGKIKPSELTSRISERGDSWCASSETPGQRSTTGKTASATIGCWRKTGLFSTRDLKTWDLAASASHSSKPNRWKAWLQKLLKTQGKADWVITQSTLLFPAQFSFRAKSTPIVAARWKRRNSFSHLCIWLDLNEKTSRS